MSKTANPKNDYQMISSSEDDPLAGGDGDGVSLPSLSSSSGNSGSSNVTPSPYQNAEEGRRFSDGSSGNDERQRGYIRHLSLQGLFPASPGGGEGSNITMGAGKSERRRVCNATGIIALFLISAGVLFVVNKSYHHHVSSSSSSSPPTNTIKEDQDEIWDLRQSCGEFFEPDPIMALKNSSTVENLKNGAVASDHPICSEVGASILRDHLGNAVDAAVATALCLGVVNPASSGMGGGAMILIHADMSSHKAKIGHPEYAPPSFDDLRGQSIMQEANPASSSGGERKAQAVPDKKITEFIDCRETAPQASKYDMFQNLPKNASVDGGLAIAVLGELRGLELAHSRHGKLPWSVVVRPAMELAQNGFPVTQHLAHDIAHNHRKIFFYKNLAYALTKDNDGKTLLKEGDIFKQPVLAQTLRDVMRFGADAIYKGDRAESLIQDIKDAGGIVTMEDLAKYRPALRSPLIARGVGGFALAGAPPPSSGGAAVIGAARFLAGYANPYATFADTLSTHRLVEASKNVFAIRMSLSDPAYNTNVTLGAVADMVEGPYMDELREETSDKQASPLSHCGGEKWAMLDDGDAEQGELVDANEGDRRKMRRRTSDNLINGDYNNVAKENFEEKESSNTKEKQSRRQMRRFGYLEDHGTTHLSVVDKDRNTVSITSTLNTYFGSGIVSPSTGLFLNSQMDDFATPGRPNYFGLEPSESNYIAPNKRPLSSMSPTLVFRPRDDDGESLGDILMALGASGGPKIISAVLQTFINYAMLGMPLYESVSNPRVHDQLLYHGKAATTYEKCLLLQGPTIEVTPRTRLALSSRGHQLLAVNYMGTVQAVAVDLETNSLTAVSDIRKGGTPAGY